jgi:tetratricopeptide (TPR) repeat protein
MAETSDGRWRTRTAPEVWAAAALAIVTLAIYLATCARTVTLVDSGELIVACATAGVAHPPGFPVYTMMGHLFSLLPVGSIAFRLSLMSAVFGAIGAAVTALIVGELGRVDGAPAGPGEPRWWLGGFLPACATGATLALSRTFWGYATVAEVYTLNLALITSVLWLMLRWRRVRAERLVAVAAFLYGLALGVHHASVVLLLPALLVLVCRAAGWRILFSRTTGVAAAAAGLGLLSYLYLPLAAARDPVLNWGDPSSWQRFLWHVTARQYQVNLFSGDLDQVLASLSSLLWSLPDEVTVLGIVVAAAGVRWLWRNDRDVVWVVLAIAALGLGYAANYEIAEDTEAYGLTTVVALVVLIGGGLRWLARRRVGTAARTAGVVVAFAALVGANLAVHWVACDRSSDRVAERFVEDALDRVGEGGLLLTMDWQLYAPYLYLRHLEGYREDATVIDVNLIRRSWYVDEYLRSTYPEVMQACAPEAAAFLRRLRDWEESRPHRPEELTALFTALQNAIIAAHVPGREAHVTLPMEPGVGHGLVWTPRGLTIQVAPGPVAGAADDPLLNIEHLRRSRRLTAVARAKVRPYYALMLTHQGSSLARVGTMDRARQALNRALELEPESSHTHAVLGELEVAEGRPEAARDHLLRALRLDPDNAAARRALERVRAVLEQR